ncbi:MAG: cellulase-like family protein [Verrucomicrobiia bacterium]
MKDIVSPNVSRRGFLTNTGRLAAVFALAGTSTTAITQTRQAPLTKCGVVARKEPAAIAMWDFSWALRHDPGCEFADWDKVLDGLVERGYNAIRFDVFPPLVATGSDGRVNDSHHFPKSGKKPVMWGNQFPTTLHPRQALKEFIPRCLDRGLLLGLSTWFFGPGNDPKRVNQLVENVQGLDGFVRVWDETLRFLKDNDLLHNIYYVDLLNEYPLFSGFKWLRGQMDDDIKVRGEKAKADGVHEWKEKVGNYNNEVSRKFYTGFANDAITRLQVKWPGLDFLFSLTFNGSADWRVMAPTKIAALDAHYWFVMNPLLSAKAGYWENIHKLADSDTEFPKVQEALLKNWTMHKPKLIEWMDQQMAEVAALGRKHNKPIGNTEGWGIINWLDHPALTWSIIKEAAEICAVLGHKHGYRFNCTSNFTHPQFPRLWADVAWHKQMTAKIRG